MTEIVVKDATYEGRTMAVVKSYYPKMRTCCGTRHQKKGSISANVHCDLQWIPLVSECRVCHLLDFADRFYMRNWIACETSGK